MMPVPVIVAANLTKYYGRRLAVDDVSFEVRPHEVMGLLGPNGSGKSTILRILTGYLRPSSGSARIAGFDVVDEGLRARSQLGYVPEDVPLYAHMRVGEFLDFMGRLRGVPGARLPQATGAVIERLSLGRVRDTLIAKLSRGYRQRAAIAQALLGQPRLLVLDEPTNGLDPRQIIEVRELIRALSRELAVLVTSHILAEIERVAHRAAILLDGRLLSVHTLAQTGAGHSFRVRVGTADDRAVRASLRSVPEVHVLDAPLPAQTYLIESKQGAAPAVLALARAGIDVLEVASSGSGLEDVFLRLTEGNAR